VHKADITSELVAQLVALQFPEWADLAVSRVELDGWDNTTFRLGTTMSVRLPSGEMYVAQVEKEQRWLPILRNQLPLPIAEPLGLGAPALGYPHPWSIYRWIDGETARDATVNDLTQFAHDLAGFLSALHRCDTNDGPRPSQAHTRGGPITVWDGMTRDAIERLGVEIDGVGATEAWDAAFATKWAGPPVWVHGDIAGTNLLVRDGRLSAVIDWGCCAIGDPACDTAIAWTFFEGESRDAFMSELALDDATWARGRGWALWKALLELVTDLSTPGHAAHAATRFGWRHSALQVVDEVIADHRGTR
jgi:aminoglycoside phosphotransferase (APT) family kinase protein